MIEQIKACLKEAGIEKYRIIEKKKESREYFYVLKKLETNRATETIDYRVTVYVPYVLDSVSYLGSSNFVVFASSTKEEMKQKVEEAKYAASFVKNKEYDLAEDTLKDHYIMDNDLNNGDINLYVEDIIKAVYRANHYEQGWINSVEVFINKHELRVITNTGTELTQVYSDGEIEVIPTWKQGTEEVELYRDIKFVNVDLQDITKKVEEILCYAQDRANAQKLEYPENIKMILHAADCLDIFDFYVSECNYQNVYQKNTHAVYKQSYQSIEAKQKLNLSVVPLLKNSTHSFMFDVSGRCLNPVQLYENSIVKNFCGNEKFGSYLLHEGVIDKLNIMPENIKVGVGEKSIEDFKSEPYLEPVSFSAFQFDEYTGYFGGEVRLAYYFDGEKKTPVTGLSISGNIYTAQNEMEFSKEALSTNGYEGPQYLIFHTVKIS